ncbi:MAG TPA: DUF6528 family protein [Bryobacteraceae bacterium]|nr:DUF6528 family protein [Bryobacteraceae bacterium]
MHNTTKAAPFFALLLLTCHASPGASDILVCGSAQVLKGSVNRHQGNASFDVNWVWRPENSGGLPISLKSNFVGTDECKPVEGGTAILITSSANALALVSYPSGATLFYAGVRNAHSAALLPDDLIVAASSSAPDDTGDRLLLFDRHRPDRALTSVPFVGAHGVEWDSSRNILWALNDHELAAFSIRHTSNQAVSLVQSKAFRLPARGGHDLVLAQDRSLLYVTTASAVFVFHPDQGTFSPFTPLQGIQDVKSLSINPETGQILYTQSDPGVWWTYQLRFLDPAANVTLGEHAYKARWFTAGRAIPK